MGLLASSLASRSSRLHYSCSRLASHLLLPSRTTQHLLPYPVAYRLHFPTHQHSEPWLLQQPSIVATPIAVAARLLAIAIWQPVMLISS